MAHLKPSLNYTQQHYNFMILKVKLVQYHIVTWHKNNISSKLFLSILRLCQFPAVNTDYNNCLLEIPVRST